MRVGEVVGSYRITGKLGAGGMGAVYLAKHTLIGREAAIKVLLPELCGNEAIVARFFNEARTTTAIKHPGIVEIYDFGYASDGSAYLVMERLEGETLGARMKRIGRLPVDHALAIARQVTGALHAAHKLGIVHRDLKPDNIYVVADAEVQGGERAKILDFGIAKLRKSDSYSAFETQEGTVMGAPTYMAPEQCGGAEKVDHRADLYSLGCILFEMVTGRPPFQGKAHGEVMAMQVNMPPPRAIHYEPMVGKAVDEVIARLLEKKPEKRYHDAFELQARLHELSGMAPPPNLSGAIMVPPPPPGADELGSPFESQLSAEPAGKLGSTVVSSARRTLALGPRKPNGAGPPPLPGHAREGGIAVTIDGPPTMEDPPRPPALPPSRPIGHPFASHAMPTQAMESPAAGPKVGYPMVPLTPSPAPYPSDVGLTTAESEAPTVWDEQRPQIAFANQVPVGPGPMQAMVPQAMGPHAMAPPAGGSSAMMPQAMPMGMMDPRSAPSVTWGTDAPRERRSGRLGLVVVALALAAGGASAYFIATSQDLTSDQSPAPPAAPVIMPMATGEKPASATPPTGATPAPTPTPTPTPAPTPTPTLAPTPAPKPAPTEPVDATRPTFGAEPKPDVKAAKTPEAAPTPPRKGAVDQETNRRPTALVTLRIDSLPRGAAVIRKKDGVRLGETPYTYEIEPQPGSVVLVLRHKGYRDEVVTLPANRSADRKIPLTRGEGGNRAPSIHD